jgi:hypothetical protein
MSLDDVNHFEQDTPLAQLNAVKLFDLAELRKLAVPPVAMAAEIPSTGDVIHTILFHEPKTASVPAVDITSSCIFDAFGYDAQSLVTPFNPIDFDTQGRAPHMFRFTLPKAMWLSHAQLTWCDKNNQSMTPDYFILDPSNHDGRKAKDACIRINFESQTVFGRCKSVDLLPTHIRGQPVNSSMLPEPTITCTVSLKSSGDNIRIRELRLFAFAEQPRVLARTTMSFDLTAVANMVPPKV